MQHLDILSAFIHTLYISICFVSHNKECLIFYKALGVQPYIGGGLCFL